MKRRTEAAEKRHANGNTCSAVVLARAKLNSWSWPEGKTAPEGHGGFIRLRMSYAFGLPDKACLPAGYEPVAELQFLSRAVMVLLREASVICYFNPNGEVLRGEAGFREVFEGCRRQNKLPVQLWTNVRLFNMDQRFRLMDTVGNGQMDIADVEAIFPKDKYAPRDVDYYLRNVTLYLLGLKREIKSGEAIDGPGETNLTWMIERDENGLAQPPRMTVRLFPKVNRAEITTILNKR